MNRIDALREIGLFVRRHQAIFASLPRDADGKLANIEIRKLLAIDPELAIALAAVIATVYFSIEHEAGIVASQGLEGRGA